MSADLTILPVPGANGFAKSISVGTSAEAGDAFGQTLLEVQNAASVGGSAVVQRGVAVVPGVGVPGVGVPGVGVVDGALAQPLTTPSGGPAATMGYSPVQVTNFVSTKTADVALTSLTSGVVGTGKGSPGEIVLAAGRRMEAKPVVAGVVGAPQARINAPGATAAMTSGGAVVMPPVADQPAAVAGVVSGHAVAALAGVDAQPSGPKHGKAVAARDGVGGQAAVAHEPVVPLAAAVALVPGPQVQNPSAGDSGREPVPASGSAGYAAASSVGPTADGLVHAMAVIPEGPGQDAGPPRDVRTGAIAPAVTETGAASAVQGPSPAGASVVPSMGDGWDSTRSSGVAGPVQLAQVAGAGPGGVGAGVAGASVSALGAGASPMVMPVGGQPPGNDASVGGVPAAGAGDVAMSRTAGAGAGASAGRAWPSGWSAPAGVVAAASPGAAETVTAVHPAGGSEAIPDVSAGGTGRGVDASMAAAGSGRDTPAAGSGRGGIGPRGPNMVAGIVAHVTASDAPAGQPVQAAPTPAAADSMLRPGRDAMAPVRPAVPFVASEVTIGMAGVGQGALSGTTSSPAAAGGSVLAGASAVAVPIVVKALDAATAFDRAAGPARGAGATAAVVSPGAPAPVRAVAVEPAQTEAVLASALVPGVAAAPVLPAAAAGGPASGLASAGGAPVATPADLVAQVVPVQSVVPVMTPVAVEDFGTASGLVPQGSSLSGVPAPKAGSGRAAATSEGSVPRFTTGDRPMQWLPTMDGASAVPSHAIAGGAVNSGAATGGGAAASGSATAAASVPAPRTARAADAAASAAVAGQGGESMPADAGAVGALASDHKITPHAMAAQSDPLPAVVSVALPEQVVPVSVPSAPSVDVPAAAAAQAPPPVRVPEPAEQVGTALLTLAKTPEGTQEMTVRMQPAELGMVQVRVTRTVSGATQIDITAEKTSTLLALQRDQPQLHRALDEAGLSAIGRTITIHAAPAAQVASSDGAPGLGGGQPGGQQAGGQQGQGGRGNTGGADADSGGGGDRGGFPGREANGYAGGRRPGIGSDLVAANANNASRAGLDITA